MLSVILGLVIVGFLFMYLVYWIFSTALSGLSLPTEEMEKRYEEKRKMERKAEIMALVEGYSMSNRTSLNRTPRQTDTPDVVKQVWEYNPNIHFNIHDEVALRNSLSFPGRHFRIYTSHSGVQGSPMLNSTSYVNINGNHRLTEGEVVIVHRVQKFKEGNDEGLEIRYTSHRGYSRTGRFYFTPNIHCSYDNFIYRMEEL